MPGKYPKGTNEGGTVSVSQAVGMRTHQPKETFIFSLICISEEVGNTNNSSDFSIKPAFLTNLAPTMDKCEEGRGKERQRLCWVTLLSERNQANI